MATTVDWGTRVITVYQADLTFLTGVSYQLDTEAFKIELRGLEASEAGQLHPPILNHSTSVTLDGIEYARILEFINGYTITFEEKASPYKVFLIGSNNNILTVTNLGTVQIAPNNSAGLINLRELQHDVFGGVVTISASGSAGSTYPKGTPLDPVNNISDAVEIAASRGLDTLMVLGDFTFSSGANLSGYKVQGQNPILTTLTIDSGANVLNCQFTNATIVNSTLDGNSWITECNIVDLTYVEGRVERCMVSGNIVIAGTQDTYFVDCKSGCVGVGATDLPVIDCGGSGRNLAFRNWAGPIKFKNLTGANNVCVDIVSGATVTLDSTMTTGNIYIRGIAELHDNSSGTVVNTLAMDDPNKARELWQRVGLDPDNPVTNKPDGGFTVGGVTVVGSQSGSDVIQTRQ